MKVDISGDPEEMRGAWGRHVPEWVPDALRELNRHGGHRVYGIDWAGFERAADDMRQHDEDIARFEGEGGSAR